MISSTIRLRLEMRMRTCAQLQDMIRYQKMKRTRDTNIELYMHLLVSFHLVVCVCVFCVYCAD